MSEATFGAATELSRSLALTELCDHRAEGCEGNRRGSLAGERERRPPLAKKNSG
jgi:hypothetical protein